MQPGRFDLTIYRGDTYHWQFALWMDVANTDPVDLADAQVKAEIRNRPSGQVVIPLVLDVELPNVINATLSATASARVPTLGAAWDLEVTYANGDVQTVVMGEVTVTADITNSTRPALTVVGAAA